MKQIMKYIKKYMLIVITTLFSLTAMAVMILFFANRDAGAESLYLTSGSNPDGDTVLMIDPNESPVRGDGNAAKDGYFCIPLEEGIREGDIEITSDAGEMITSVTIPVKDGDFYYVNNLSGSREHIESVEFKTAQNKVVFEIRTDDRTIPHTLFEEGHLFIRFDPISDIYDRIVVVDAGHGGDDSGTVAYDILEKDVTLGVAKQLEKLRTDYKGVFFTRLEDISLSEEDRLKLSGTMGADLIITLHTNADKDTRITRGIKILYNDPSVKDMADALADKLKGVSDEKEISVVMDKEPGFFDDAKIPCIVIRMGYMTNKAEALMLGEEDHQKEIAEAIASVIMK